MFSSFKRTEKQNNQYIAFLNHIPANMSDVYSFLKKSSSRTAVFHSCLLMSRPVFLSFFSLFFLFRTDTFNAALQAASGEAFLGRPGQQRCRNSTPKPLIPLLMHSYKYSTGAAVWSCGPGSTRAAPGLGALRGAFAINTDEGNTSRPCEMIPSETLCLIFDAASRVSAAMN